jgi:hypothetical protein
MRTRSRIIALRAAGIRRFRLRLSGAALQPVDGVRPNDRERMVTRRGDEVLPTLIDLPETDSGILPGAGFAIRALARVLDTGVMAVAAWWR